MRQIVSPPLRLEGEITPPGDKSISHRVAIFNGLARGTARITNYAPGQDCASTLACLGALGVEIDKADPTSLTIQGRAGALQEPADVLNAGNSGTTMRLLAGVLAGQPFLSILTGDRSLRSRPMDRVITPLRAMGAQIWGRNGDSLAPLAIRGGNLQGIIYTLPVASAQVKSCILLAGLFAQGETVVVEPAPTRDHTERLFQVMGAAILRDGLTVRLKPGVLTAKDVVVPGDISSAAFWLVAGACHPQGRITVHGVGVNPTRTGILDALRQMGARLEMANLREEGGEPVADITVSTSTLEAIEVKGALVPRLIDELPVLAVAACYARGTTLIRDAQELRVKESDRIATMVRELRRMGADIEELPDGMRIRGPRPLKGAVCRSYGDHRVAMALAVAGLLARGETTILGAECAAVSYPTFWKHLALLTGAQGRG
ncbi:MAG: 3-phosphoshikimate 1-carboxyvinyltransferase [Dehalococcoidia bacterium]|nr:3-phosphoshikimate 1-carboxyvinyltransferase [Dehalococcoidia bacterium]MDW8119452.1 3-phosphoshikimate 1-carboxyvinyltransferase [Chloroflexota bacterium]